MGNEGKKNGLQLFEPLSQQTIRLEAYDGYSTWDGMADQPLFPRPSVRPPSLATALTSKENS